MSESIFASLLNTLDKRSVGTVAHALGQPEQSVSHGMETSIAALLGGMASKSQEPAALQRVLDTVSGTGEDVSWSKMASGLSAPGSPVMSAGKRVLSILFGSKESSVVNGISASSGLTSGAASTLLSMVAPMVMTFLTGRMRDGGMNISSLGSLLQRESGTIRNALPAGMSELLLPGTTTTVGTVGEVSPVIAQSIQQERSGSSWLPALAIAALALGLLWFLSHARRPTVLVVAPPIGVANRFAPPPPAVNTTCTLPANLNLPAGGVGSRLLAFVQSPGELVGTTWFNADRMVFDTGSANLQPNAEEELNNVAAILTGCPSVHMAIVGYTDNVGSPEANVKLSRNRANAVAAKLVTKGVSRDRLSTEGLGEENPIADNSTTEGRAQNRRIAMRVTQR